MSDQLKFKRTGGRASSRVRSPKGEIGLKQWLEADEVSNATEQRGAIILVAARWVLIVVGMVLTLNSPASLVDLQVSVAAILSLAVVNFILHTRLLTKRETSSAILQWTSAGDIVVIIAITALSGGYFAYAFVFFYPALLAYSLALPFRVTATLTAGMVALYAAVVVLVSSEALAAEPAAVGSTLVARLLTFVGVMAVANMYRWVEYRRLEDEAPVARSARRAARKAAAQPAAASLAESGLTS